MGETHLKRPIKLPDLVPIIPPVRALLVLPNRRAVVMTVLVPRQVRPYHDLPFPPPPSDTLRHRPSALQRAPPILRRLRFPQERLDLGGGLGVPYHGQTDLPSIDDYVAMCARVLDGLDVEAAFEPGRLLAANAGVRAGICMIPVPSLSVVVRAPSHARTETASVPHASAVQAES